jgi:hypothetical protein
VWWMVVEEQRGGGDARAWNVTKTKPADREHADEIARRLAFSHELVHPSAVKELRVADGYVVPASDPTAKCHFRVTLGHRVVTP